MKIIYKLLILLLFAVPSIFVGIFTLYTLGWFLSVFYGWITDSTALLCNWHPINFDSVCLHLFLLACLPFFLNSYKKAIGYLNKDLYSIVNFLIELLFPIIIMIILFFGFSTPERYELSCVIAGLITRIIFMIPIFIILLKFLKGR